MEQPEAKAADYTNLFEGNHVFCIGRNHTNSLEDALIFTKDKHGGYDISRVESKKDRNDGDVISPASDHAVKQIYQHSPTKVFFSAGLLNVKKRI